MARSVLPQALVALADAQSGLLTRTQLHDGGVTAKVVRARVADEWRMVLPGIVSLSRMALDEPRKLAAARLLAGPDAVLSGAWAAHRLGLANARPHGPLTFLVPASAGARRESFVVLVRTHRMPRGRVAQAGLPLAPVARAVGDACRWQRDRRYAEALLIEAVQKRRCSVTALYDELYAGPRRGSVALRAGIEAAGSGVWSVAELDLLQLVATSRLLPAPWPNPELRDAQGSLLPTPDLWFDNVGLAVQVHSRAFHADGDDWARTVRADSALAEAGVLRVALTPREIRAEPAGVLARLERTYTTLAPADRPRVKASPRPT